MAALALANVNYQSSAFKEALSASFTDELGVLKSALVQAPENMISSNDKGVSVSIPVWNFTADTMNQITANGTLTPDQLTQRLERASWIEREIAFDSESMITTVSGQDPTLEVASQAGKLLSRTLQESVISVLTGIMTTALLATHVYDDANNTVSTEALIAAKGKIGDAMKYLNVMVGNSKVHNDMLSKKILVESGANTDSFSSGMVERVLGMAFVADDALTLAGGVYKSYLLALGSLVYKFRNRQKPAISAAQFFNVATEDGIIADFEVSRSALVGGGTDILSIRTSYIVHPFGLQFAATANPADTDLATGSNWTKAATDNKEIKIVQYISS